MAFKHSITNAITISLD